MTEQKYTDKLSKFFRFLCILLPFCLLVFGAYFIYFGIYQRNKIKKTYDDIITITKNIKSSYNGVYKDFNNENIILRELLPYDIHIDRENNNYGIFNRFGGQIFFYEAFFTMQEKILYFSLYNEPQKYKQLYNGTTAYLMLFTGLTRRQCRILATTDWKSFAPNYIGLEVSYLDNHGKYNGVFKLKTQLLSEPDTKYYASKDEGIISSVPLTFQEAKNSCICSNNNCTIALKFN